MIPQINQRIIVKEELKVNNSPLKLAIAFLNQELNSETKESYYKLLIWFLGDEYVQDFDFHLFLKVQGQSTLVPLENLSQDFQPNLQHYLIAKIPSKPFNPFFNELTYTFTHDQLFAGQGQIFLNLKIDDDQLIDNELLFYANHQSQNLITRTLSFEIPDFYFNQHYQKVLTLKSEAKVNSESPAINLKPIQALLELVKNRNWFEPIKVLNFDLYWTRTQKNQQEYDFEPNFETVRNDDEFQVNLLNFLTLNQQHQIVEGGSIRGMLFNPLIAEQQTLTIKLKVYSLEKVFQVNVCLPKLSFTSDFQGAWIAI